MELRFCVREKSKSSIWIKAHSGYEFIQHIEIYPLTDTFLSSGQHLGHLERSDESENAVFWSTRFKEHGLLVSQSNVRESHEFGVG